MQDKEQACKLQLGRRAAYERQPSGAILTGSGSLCMGSRVVSCAVERQQPEGQGWASYLLLGEREADRSDIVPRVEGKHKADYGQACLER